MAKEIERKFLVLSQAYRELGQGKAYHQGYLAENDRAVVRVRTIDRQGFLTVKSATLGLVREEFEFEIGYEEACEMLEKLCQKPTIKKRRYKVPHQGLVWEVDEFELENQGLVVAELELPSTDHAFEKPDWVGREVTHDKRYYNTELVRHPYQEWRGEP